MIDLIACILVRLLNIIFRFIPISVSLWFGRRLGSIVYTFNKKRRLVAYANLKAAFGKEKTPRELRAITKRVYQNLVQTFIEILNLTKVNKKYVDKYVQIPDRYLITNAAKSGRGTILLTAHFGDWELSNLTSSMIGFPIIVLVREQKMKRLNELLNRLRESKGCKVARKGMSTKNMIRALHDKNIVGILSDQDAGKNGVFVDFFGRPTSTHAGPAEIAKRTDSLILPNFIVRVKGPYHKVCLENYIDFRQIKGDDDVKEGLQKFANILESYIRKYPDQWLWPHKRWKSTPARTVLVLNDGKQGHLNQSLSVAGQIRKARAAQGYKIDDTKIITVNVKYKNDLLKGLLGVCASFSNWRCHGRMGILRLCLTNEAYRALMRTYSEFIVSCGSSLAPVNVFMAHENNARNIVIMKPSSVFGLRKFSLVVIPKHDRPGRSKNVVTTVLAPNLMDSEILKSQGELLRKRVNLERKPVVGLLIGGDNPEYSLDKDVMNKALDGVLSFCKAHKAELLVTTSRRTSKDAETVLKSRLAGEGPCKLLVIANEHNIDEAVGGILDSSDIVVVSGESISMVSEAVSALKKVIAFSLAKKSAGITKHEKALNGLEGEGYLTNSEPENLLQAMEQALNTSSPVKKVDDRERIFEAVRRLI